MNLETISVTPTEARAKLAAYQRLETARRTAEDDALEQMYAALRKGGEVLDVPAAIRAAGLNELGQPRLAIARADWPTAFCSRGQTERGFGLLFGDGANRPWRIARRCVFVDEMPGLPTTYDPGFWGGAYSLRTPVPHIPPEHRPRIALSSFYILFEVERWETYAVDPLLLRRIPRTDLFIVLASWDLTPLEASLLGSLRR